MITNAALKQNLSYGDEKISDFAQKIIGWSWHSRDVKMSYKDFELTVAVTENENYYEVLVDLNPYTFTFNIENISWTQRPYFEGFSSFCDLDYLIKDFKRANERIAFLVNQFRNVMSSDEISTWFDML